MSDSPQTPIHFVDRTRAASAPRPGSRWAVLLHGLLGWVICGAVIALGRPIAQLSAVLWVHAAVAPMAFGLLAWRVQRRWGPISPWGLAFVWLALLLVLDTVVVAWWIEGSFAMFASPLGTWMPLGSSFVVTGLAAQHALPPEPPPPQV